MPIQHVKSVTIADGTNTDVVRPSDWNSVHAYTLQDAIQIGGNTTAVGGATSSISSGTAFLAGGNNITLSQDANSVTISASGNYLSTYYPFPAGRAGTGTTIMSLGTNTSAPMTLWGFQVIQPVLAEFVGVIVSMSLTTGGTSTFRQSGSLGWGLYSRLTGANSTRMSVMGSSSFSYGVTYNNSSITINQPTTTNAGGADYGTANTNSSGLSLSSQYTGLKYIMLKLNSTLTPGFYWLGMHHRNSSSGGGNIGIQMSMYGIRGSFTNLAPMGSLSSAFTTGTNIPLEIGGNFFKAASYSVANMTTLTNDITMSQLTMNVELLPFMLIGTRV
jgi:hypothetical protein